MRSFVIILVTLLMGFLAPSAAWGAEDSASAIGLSITESTPVVTSDSGYHIVVSVRNSTNAETPGGKLTVSTNSWYTFVSRSDLQH